MPGPYALGPLPPDAVEQDDPIEPVAQVLEQAHVPCREAAVTGEDLG